MPARSLQAYDYYYYFNTMIIINIIIIKMLNKWSYLLLAYCCYLYLIHLSKKRPPGHRQVENPTSPLEAPLAPVPALTHFIRHLN